MNPIQKQARIAGLLYFLVGITAPIGLVYVPGKLIVSGDATATADRLRASEWLLRLGMGSELFHQVIGIFLVLALYRLFETVSKPLAVHMVVLSLVPVPVMFLNVLNEVAALLLTTSTAYLSVLEQPQRDALALMFLRLHGQGINVASIFWGLWLFPFGMLVIRSGFIPRVLGYLMMIAGAAYLASAATTVLMPQYAKLVGRYAIILEIGELPIMFWLLIWGARTRQAEARAT